MPEWISILLFLGGLPVLMLLLQQLVRRWFPCWETGVHNDAAGVMLSAAVVVYSVAIGLCVITLWEKLDDAQRSTQAEAMNLAAVAEGARVCDAAVAERIRAGVVAYNRDVVDRWPLRIRGIPQAQVSADLDALVATVAQVEPETQAQRALDSVEQWWFDDIDALRAALGSAYFAERVAPARAGIVDPRYVFSLTSRENWVIGP